MEGTRLTIVKVPSQPDAYEFSIRTPVTPPRWRDFDQVPCACQPISLITLRLPHCPFSMLCFTGLTALLMMRSALARPHCLTCVMLGSLHIPYAPVLLPHGAF